MNAAADSSATADPARSVDVRPRACRVTGCVRLAPGGQAICWACADALAAAVPRPSEARDVLARLLPCEGEAAVRRLAGMEGFGLRRAALVCLAVLDRRPDLAGREGDLLAACRAALAKLPKPPDRPVPPKRPDPPLSPVQKTPPPPPRVPRPVQEPPAAECACEPAKNPAPTGGPSISPRKENEMPRNSEKKGKGTCLVPGCPRPAKNRGVCSACYLAHLKNPDGERGRAIAAVMLPSSRGKGGAAGRPAPGGGAHPPVVPPSRGDGSGGGVGAGGDAEKFCRQLAAALGIDLDARAIGGGRALLSIGERMAVVEPDGRIRRVRLSDEEA